MKACFMVQCDLVCSLSCTLSNLPHFPHLKGGEVHLGARGEVGYSPCLVPFHDTAFLFQLPQLVWGLVFEFGGNVARELDVREFGGPERDRSLRDQRTLEAVHF